MSQPPQEQPARNVFQEFLEGRITREELARRAGPQWQEELAKQVNLPPGVSITQWLESQERGPKEPGKGEGTDQLA